MLPYCSPCCFIDYINYTTGVFPLGEFCVCVLGLWRLTSVANEADRIVQRVLKCVLGLWRLTSVANEADRIVQRVLNPLKPVHFCIYKKK